jgi:hypothetical protein
MKAVQRTDGVQTPAILARLQSPYSALTDLEQCRAVPYGSVWLP